MVGAKQTRQGRAGQGRAGQGRAGQGRPMDAAFPVMEVTYPPPPQSKLQFRLTPP